MKTILRSILVFGIAIAMNYSSAITVDESTSAYFSFDVSAFTPVTFERFQYNGFDCCTDDIFLDAGASFRMDIGTSLGGSDLAIAYVTNPLDFGINNISSAFQSVPEAFGDPISFDIGVDFDTIFITVSYFDDVFVIDRLLLWGPNAEIIEGVAVSNVPLPASLYFFVLSLGVLGIKKKRSLGVKPSHSSAEH